MYGLIGLFGAGLVAGFVNSVAGGGAILIYPLLFALGLQPVTVNATITVSIWPGSLSSAYGYRKHLRKLPRRYFLIIIPSLIGGIIGAVELMRTSNHSFKIIVPWLIILSVILLAMQPTIHQKLKSHRRKAKMANLLSLSAFTLALTAIGIYGGYFGAGYGIMMLALLGFTKLTDLHQMNGLKNIAALFITLCAGTYFTYHGMADWHYAPVLMVGSLIGGYFGATYSTKLPTPLIRKLITVLGIAVAVILVVKY